MLVDDCVFYVKTNGFFVIPIKYLFNKLNLFYEKKQGEIRQMGCINQSLKIEQIKGNPR